MAKRSEIVRKMGSILDRAGVKHVSRETARKVEALLSEQ
jgi:hypothetical protein